MTSRVMRGANSGSAPLSVTNPSLCEPFVTQQAARQHGVIRTEQIGRDSAAIRRAVLSGRCTRSTAACTRSATRVSRARVNGSRPCTPPVTEPPSPGSAAGSSGRSPASASRDPDRHAEATPPAARLRDRARAPAPGEWLIRDAIPVCTSPRPVRPEPDAHARAGGERDPRGRVPQAASTRARSTDEPRVAQGARVARAAAPGRGPASRTGSSSSSAAPAPEPVINTPTSASSSTSAGPAQRRDRRRPPRPRADPARRPIQDAVSKPRLRRPALPRGAPGPPGGGPTPARRVRVGRRGRCRRGRRRTPG